MKKAVLFCTCCGAVSATLPPEALEKELCRRTLRPLSRTFAEWASRRKGNANGRIGDASPEALVCCFIASTRLCRKEEAASALASAREAGVEGLTVAACSLSAKGGEIVRFLAEEMPLEWVDIREGCAWIHADRPASALAKAVDILCAGLAALERRTGDAEDSYSATPSPATRALVIGGGPAGLACAAAFGDMGISAVLAERRAVLGGMLPQIGVLFPAFTSGPDLALNLAREAEAGGTEIRCETAVTAARPVPEGYSMTLRGKSGEEEQVFGAVIFAAGALPVLPRGYFRYGELAGVSSQMELETLLGKVERGEEQADILPRNAVFLQCVAARDEKNPYCSAICCPTALKNALRLRSLAPDGSVTVVHRNIVTPGIHLENMYRQATASGVRLRSHDPLVVPEAVGKDRLEGLRFRDALDGEDAWLPADRLVCSTPLKPSPAAASLAFGLGLRLDSMGFVCGREPVQPLASHSPGVFICGTARWPVVTEHSLQQGRAAAAKAAAYLRGLTRRASGQSPGFRSLPKTVGELLPEAASFGSPARIRQEACSRCGRCVAACPYGACAMSEDGVEIFALRCARCGSCAAVCPSGAACLPEESIAMLRARIKEALGGKAV